MTSTVNANPAAEAANDFWTRVQERIARGPGLDISLTATSPSWVAVNAAGRKRLVFTALAATGAVLWISAKIDRDLPTSPLRLAAMTAVKGNRGTQYHYGVTLWAGQPGTADATKIATGVPIDVSGEPQYTAIHEALLCALVEINKDEAVARAAGAVYTHTGEHDDGPTETHCVALPLAATARPQAWSILPTRLEDGTSKIDLSEECLVAGLTPAFAPPRAGQSQNNLRQGRIVKGATRAFGALLTLLLEQAGPIPALPQRQIRRTLSAAEIQRQENLARAGLSTEAPAAEAPTSDETILSTFDGVA